MSPFPERALRSADRLGDMCPDAGHMNHMPGHIYALCGEYEKAKIASGRQSAPTTRISLMRMSLPIGGTGCAMTCI